MSASRAGLLAALADKQDLYQNTFRNKLINGNFDFWQRGSSFSLSANAALYVADRFLAAAGSGGVATVTQGVRNSPGGENRDALGTNYLTYSQTTGGTTTPVLYQQIEDLTRVSGRTMTFSAVFTNTGSTAMTFSVVIRQYFGTGIATVVDTNLNNLETGGTTVTVAAGATVTLRFSGDIPSTVGKTINANNLLGVILALPLNQVFSFATCKWQFEDGQVPSPFEWRPYALELAQCQRYYEKSFLITETPVSGSSSTALLVSTQTLGASLSQNTTGCLLYKAVKRVTSTITFYSPSGGAGGQMWNASKSLNSTSTQVYSSNQYGFSIAHISASGSAIGDYLVIHWTADAELPIILN